MKKKVFIIILIIIIVAAIAGGLVYFRIFNTDESEEEKTEENVINWNKEYTEYLTENNEEDIQIGLFDFNLDLIPELLVKTTDNLYKILYIDTENNTVEVSSIEDVEIEELNLIYDDTNQKYCYAYTLVDEPEVVKIINEDLSKEPENIDNTTEEYLMNYVKIQEELLEKMTDGSITDIAEAMNKAEENYQTTDEYIEEAGIDVEAKIEEIKKELSEKLTEEEAIEIGEELYEYGTNLDRTYDQTTRETYIGKSKTKANLDSTLNWNEYSPYKLGDISDVEDYFTEKRIKELDLSNYPQPYGLKKYNGDWYYCSAPVGSSIFYLGTRIEVKSIETKKITFTAISYDSTDYMEQNEEYPDEVNDELLEGYEYTTEENEFVIVKEDGKWKIDTQTIIY